MVRQQVAVANRGHAERVCFQPRWVAEWGDFRFAPDARVVREQFFDRAEPFEALDALLKLYDARIEFLPLTGEIAVVWEEMRPHADATLSVGEHVIVIGGCAVRGRGSGAESDDPMAWVIMVRGGKSFATVATAQARTPSRPWG